MRTMRKIIVLMLLATVSLMTFAQDVKKGIRDDYAAMKERMANIEELEASGDEYPVPIYYKVNMKDNLPGTGGHYEEIRLFFNELEVDEIYPPHYMVFATVKYNFAARKYYEEYMYDKAGNIRFIFAQIPDVDEKDIEMRLYYKQGKLFDVLVKKRDFGEKEYTNDYSGKTVPAKYAAEYKRLSSYVTKLTRLFKSVDDARHL